MGESWGREGLRSSSVLLWESLGPGNPLSPLAHFSPILPEYQTPSMSIPFYHLPIPYASIHASSASTASIMIPDYPVSRSPSPLSRSTPSTPTPRAIADTSSPEQYPFPTVSTQTPHSAHPSFSTTQSSPPPTASPFAFAPPPLSAPATTTFFRTPYAPQPNSDSQSIAAPAASPSFPNQTQQEQSAYSQGQRMMPPIAPPQHSAPIPSYPYSSVSMNYRSYSNDSTHGQKVSNSPAPGANLMRTPSLNLATPQSIPSQLSPALSSPYPYARQYQPTPNSVNAQYGMPSPQPRPNYPYMQAPEMPRSLTYPSYAQPYPSPQYAPQASMSTPSFHHSGVGLLRPSEASHSSPDIRPHIGYSFANRLPLVDRPFKCDECVQSFVSLICRFREARHF